MKFKFKIQQYQTDAVRSTMVKRIAVRGFEIKNLKGTSGYMYLDGMVLSPKEVKGKFQKIFEQEYSRIVQEYKTIFDTDYDKYLSRFRPYETHNGYFSIDKKGHSVECAKRLFNSLSTSEVRYGVVDKFDHLYDIINGIV